jgi:hypothetical protein
MIGEITPSIYDVAGRPVSSVTRKHQRLFHGTFPMGRYVSQPLTKSCSSIKEVRRFLSECEYVSDKEQFNKDDYWLPPEEFEKRKKGDCEDFALWTWRQLLSMGYKSRYVVGRAGRYGEGHAWVTIERDGKHFIVEPLAWVGESLPRLSVIRYEPRGSVEWDGKRLRYFIHDRPEGSIPLIEFAWFGEEWLFFWSKFWLYFLYRLCLLPYLILRRFLRKKQASEEVRPTSA